MVSCEILYPSHYPLHHLFCSLTYSPVHRQITASVASSIICLVTPPPWKSRSLKFTIVNFLNDKYCVFMFYCLYLRMHTYVTIVSLFYMHIPVALSTYACIFMTCPGLQKPHWLPLYWARRLGMALSLVESMPSMVVISHPSQENKGTRHYGKISMQDYVMGIWYEWQC